MRANKNNPRKVLFCTIVLIGLVAFFNISNAAANGESAKRMITLGKPLVIQVGNDINIQSAVNTLTDNIDHIRVEKISTNTNPNSLLGSYNSIFFVGHGSEIGIGQSDEVVLSWQAVKTIINRHPSAKAYIISCNADKFIVENNICAFGTSGIIDAELGARLSIVKFLMDKGADTDILRDSLDSLVRISRTKPEEDYLTLALIFDSSTTTTTTTTTTTSTTTSTSSGYWSAVEIIGAVIDTVVCFLCAATAAYYLKGAIITAAKIAIVAVTGSIILMATYLTQLAMGGIDTGRFLSAMLFVLIGICATVIKNLAWWQAMAISASFAAFVAGTGATGGGSLAIVIAICAITLGVIGWTVYKDILDSNPYYAM